MHEGHGKELNGRLGRARNSLRLWLAERLGTAPPHSIADADDLVQDVLFSASRAAATLRRHDAASLRAWLRRIALNRLIDELRKRRGPACDESGTDVAARAGEPRPVRFVLRLLRDCERLNDEQRLVVVLRNWLATDWGTTRFLLERVSEKATRNVHLRARHRLTHAVLPTGRASPAWCSTT